MAKHVQDAQITAPPAGAAVGDVWTDDKTYKRVLSRGGAWENVDLGAKHPDEVDDNGGQSGAEAGGQSSQVSDGSDSTAQGDGDDGEDSESSDEGEESGAVDENKQLLADFGDPSAHTKAELTALLDQLDAEYEPDALKADLVEIVQGLQQEALG